MDNTPNIFKNKKIVLVDGFLIRNTLDSDFNIAHFNHGRIGWYAPRWYIPKDEIWIDNVVADESEFLIKELDMEAQDIDGDYSKYREKIKKALLLPGPIPEYTERIERNNGYTIRYVDGGIVRRYIDPAFVIDGQGFVYNYVPKNELWIDAKLNPKEYPYIITHLTVECAHMKEGASYDIAHEYATVAEKEHRRNDGIGSYPGDANYPWYNLSNEEIIKKYVIEVLKSSH